MDQIIRNNFKKMIGGILFLILLFFYIETRIYSKNNPENYLEYRSINLNNHLINTHKTNKKVALLLGSSSIAGNSFDLNRSLADYLNELQPKFFFYNLGSLEGTLLDSMVFLDKALALKKVDRLIIGLGPDMFKFNYDGLVPIANIESLEKFLSGLEMKKIKKEKGKKFYFEPVINLVSTSTIPFKAAIELKSRMRLMSNKYLGEHYDFKIENRNAFKLNFLTNDQWLYNLKQFIIYCKDKEIEVYAYLEPYLYVDQVFEKNEMIEYEKSLIDFLNKNSIKHYNFMRSIPNDPHYFGDYQHLSPDGFARLGRLLSGEISRSDL